MNPVPSVDQPPAPHDPAAPASVKGAGTTASRHGQPKEWARPVAERPHRAALSAGDRPTRHRRHTAALAGLLLLALISRCWGTWFDHAHFDEWIAFKHSAQLLHTGELDLQEYGPVFLMWSVVPQLVAETLSASPPVQYMLHRMWSGVLPAVATIAMVWWVALQLTGSRRAALLAGVLLAFAFVHFEASHYAKPDTLSLALLFSTVVVALGGTSRTRHRAAGCAESAARTGGLVAGSKSPAVEVDPSLAHLDRRRAVLLGVLMGAAVACRLNLAVLACMWPLYMLLLAGRSRFPVFLKLFAVYGLAAAATFVAGHLFCLRALDWSVPRLFALLTRGIIINHYTYATLCDRPWWYYFAPFGHDLPAWGVGLPMALAAAAGMVFGWTPRCHRALWCAIVASVVLYAYFLCSERVRIIRWSIALSPFVAVFIAVAFHRLQRLIAQRWRQPRLATAMVTAATLLLIARPARQMLLFALSASQTPSTLTAAKQWMVTRGSTAYRVFGTYGWGAHESGYPYHYPATSFSSGYERTMDRLEWIGRRVGLDKVRIQPKPRPDPANILGAMEIMRRDNLEYIVVGGWHQHVWATTPDEYAHDVAIKRRLLAFAKEADARLRLCARFAPRHAADWGMTALGRQQTIAIYALPPSVARPAATGEDVPGSADVETPRAGAASG